MTLPATACTGDIAAWFRDRPATTAGVRVLAIEGRSGSGKSTLATALAARTGAPVIHMDDLYQGWDGLLAGVDALLAWILGPLHRGEPARWRRYDWDRDEYAEWHALPPADALIIEGVGSGARQAAPYLSGLIWLEATESVRRSRALARDGDRFAPHWDRWARQEDRYYACHDVRGRADLVLVTG